MSFGFHPLQLFSHLKQYPFLLLFFIMGVSSCDQNSCEDVQCGFRQTCVNGNCVCPAGYEGDNCDIRSREKFIGQYDVFKSCFNGTSPPNNYFTSITAGSNVENVIITDIIGQGLGAEAVVRDNFIQIPQQNLGATKISGEGRFQEGSKSISMQVQYTQGGRQHTCDLTFQRQ